MLRQYWQRWRQQQRYRVFILPSRYGLSYSILIVVMLLGAINYNNSLGHLLCFLLVGVGHVAMHHSYRNVRQLDYQLGRAEPVFCQQPILLPLNLTNQSPRPIRQLDIAYLPSISRSGWWPLKQFSRYLPVYKAPQLAAEQTSLHLIPIPTDKRGWQDLGRLRLSSVYPIGLLLSWFFIDIQQRVLIYPRPMGNKPLPPPSAMEDSGDLQHQQGLDDFAGFHRYRVGDARQHIAWKALARDGILRTKQFSSPSGQKMLFNWDDVADLPDTEAKLSQLCQWILAAETAGMQYGLILPEHTIAIDSGNQHRHFCLQSLALYGQ
jgi:uncharacterized protein (DUF58 family)